MEVRLAVLPGDGVGPEVTEAAVRVLDAVLAAEGRRLVTDVHPMGWTAVRQTGRPLPDETLEACLRADAVFLGAVGHPDADGAPHAQRPETGLLALRKKLGCWANLRPLRVPPSLVQASAGRPERVGGTDLVILRELAGGLYYGEPRGTEGDRAWNTMVYSEGEVRRIAELACDLAAARSGRVTSVDKANVLEVSRLWRRVTQEVVDARADVQLDHMLVDRAAMEIVLNPKQFDVLLTENLFGDILSDEASVLAGSLGVLGSASLGGRKDLYEPVHGSAPDIAGRGVANPLGSLASIALMLRHTLGLPRAAERLEIALDRTLEAGIRTPDLRRAGPEEPVGTQAFTEAVLERLDGSYAGSADANDALTDWAGGVE
jgi:3-isopropylmalate dehydrogenase